MNHESFCAYCGKVKPTWVFHTKYRCMDCKIYRQRIVNKGLPLPPPIWKIAHYHTRQNQRSKKQKLTAADKARICELSFGFNVPIHLIAEIEGWVVGTVSRAISEYLGTGLPPVLMSIDISDDIDPKP